MDFLQYKRDSHDEHVAISDFWDLKLKQFTHQARIGTADPELWSFARELNFIQIYADTLASVIVLTWDLFFPVRQL